MEKAAKVISFLFHPLLMPTYAFALVIVLNPYLFAAIPVTSRLLLIILIFSYTFLFPLLMAFLFIKLNLIKSLHMHTGKERIYPFLLTIITYGTITYRFMELPYPGELNAVLMTSTAALLFAFIINLKWKISIHSIGIAGLASIVYYNTVSFNYQLLLLMIMILLLAGIIGTARLLVSNHTKEQVYIGYLVGWASAGLAYWWVG